jgi:riboflavin kinase/FMN adenylyltransferase
LNPPFLSLVSVVAARYFHSGIIIVLVEEELADFSPIKDTLLTIGVFDGVHLGHRHLISVLKKHAAERNLLCGVVTFRRHPLDIIAPETCLPYLTGIDEKVRLLKNEGVDFVVPLTFNTELAGLSAGQFAGLLKKHLRMRGLVIGPDFALGKDREGDAATLSKIGKVLDFTVEVVPPMKINGDIASSTAIRKAIAEGDMAKVIRLIGRPFRLLGDVVAGDGRGTKLGFPTANLEIDSRQTLPPEGVYATRTHLGDKEYKSVTNIGKRPTFGDNPRTIETYIIGFSGNIYGKPMKIDIIERLRGEKRFDTVEDLKKQVFEDIEKSKTILDFLDEK